MEIGNGIVYGAEKAMISRFKWLKAEFNKLYYYGKINYDGRGGIHPEKRSNYQ